MTEPNEQYPRVDKTGGGVRVDNGGVALALAGAIVGAIASYVLFYYLAQNHGRILFALPAAGPGIGRALFTRTRSFFVAGVCLALGAGTALYIANGFFVQGLQDVPELGWAAIVAGSLISLWFGLGRKAT